MMKNIAQSNLDGLPVTGEDFSQFNVLCLRGVEDFYDYRLFAESYAMVKGIPYISWQSANRFYQNVMKFTINYFENLPPYEDARIDKKFSDGYASFINFGKPFKDGIYVVESFSDKIHFSLLDEYISSIVDIIKERNSQFFLFTQSKEIIDTFAKVAKQKSADMSYFRCGVNVVDGNRAMTKYSADEVLNYSERGIEIR